MQSSIVISIDIGLRTTAARRFSFTLKVGLLQYCTGNSSGSSYAAVDVSVILVICWQWQTVAVSLDCDFNIMGRLE